MKHGVADGEAIRHHPSLTIDDYPVREYLASMSAEMAGLARRDGDARLAALFDVAADVARSAPKAVGSADAV